MKTNRKTSLSLSKETLEEFNLTKNEVELTFHKTMNQDEALLTICKITNRSLEALGIYALPLAKE